MACNASKAPFLRIVSKRGFSAQVKPRPLGLAAEVKVCSTPNNILIATADSALPISRVSVVFRAGARRETYENLGANHVLRVAASLSSKERTGFSLTRNLQQIGGSLTATSDREIVSYTIETTVDQQDLALNLLADVLQPAFKPWELEDVVPLIRTQVAAVPPQVRAVELLHRAAFRTGLGNSLYMSKHRIGKLSSETLQHYVAQNFTANRCAIVGVGVDQTVLSGFAQNLDLPTSGGEGSTSKYKGGEVRKEKGGDLAFVAIGGEAVFANSQEALAYRVLENAWAPEIAVKRGGSNGNISKAVLSSADKGRVSVNALSAIYCETGIFGFVLAAEAGAAGKAVEAAVKVLKSGAVSNEDVNRGKALLKAAVLEAYGTDSGLISTITSQAALGCVSSASDILSGIDALTQTDIQAAARKVATSKLSLGAVGNLSKVPYAADF